MPQRLRKYREERGSNAEDSEASGAAAKGPTRANIRTWIHERAVSRLRQLVWEGHGSKLLLETTANPAVKKFLDAVPQVLTAIKEVHSLAVTNGAEQLKIRTAPPAPRELLLSRDSNGLTPLHKAAGLGNCEAVRIILEGALESVRVKDDQGKLPLHYAAFAVGSSGVREESKEITYHLLVEAGSDESQTDNRGKTASYYLQHPNEVDSSRLLVIPEAPRTASTAENGGVPQSSQWVTWRLLVAAAPMKRVTESLPKGKEKEPPEEEPSKPVTKAEDSSRGLEGRSEEAGEQKRGSLLPPQFSLPPTPPPKPASQPISPEKIPSTTEIDSTIPVKYDPPIEHEDRNSSPKAEISDEEAIPNAEQQKANVQSEEEPNTVAREESFSPKQNGEGLDEMMPMEAKKASAERQRNVTGHASGETELEYQVQDEEELIRAAQEGDVDFLLSAVLSGEGSRLIGLTSNHPNTQSFLYDVPIHMELIREIHEAASNGSLKDIQGKLDRRKYAIAREPTIKATPLHSAVLGTSMASSKNEKEDNEAMVRYLGSRFPETINQKDTYGRTPLHYATALQNEETRLKLYELLRQLGADSTIEDNLGHTPSHYLSNPKDFPLEDLLPYIEYIHWDRAKEMTANSLLDDGEKNVTTPATPESSIGSPASSNDHDPPHALDGPVLWSEEEQYLAKSLGEPLVKGLTEVSHRRPKDPVAFLANYLKSFTKTHHMYSESLTESIRRMNREAQGQSLDDSYKIEPYNDVFRMEERDEHGQTVIHRAAGRSGSRGSLLHLIKQTFSNVALRDEHFRTPRDVAARAGLRQNVREIDSWVVTLATAGSDDERDKLELEPAINMLRSLILEGYDHILDAHTSNGSGDNQDSFRSKKTSILEVATESTYLPIISLLRSVPIFEERREWLHSAIRAGSLEHTQEILLATSDSFDDTLRDSSPLSPPTSPSLPNSPEDVKIDLHHQDWMPMELNSSEKFSSFLGPPALAVAKNRRSRCSMHIAVLCQQLEIARFIAHHFPQTLHVGDNLERTPLHYAMGIPSVDTFSQILIQAGAKRIVKDLKGKQPSYYFINKSEIRKLLDEELLRE